MRGWNYNLGTKSKPNFPTWNTKAQLDLTSHRVPELSLELLKSSKPERDGTSRKVSQVVAPLRNPDYDRKEGKRDPNYCPLHGPNHLFHDLQKSSLCVWNAWMADQWESIVPGWAETQENLRGTKETIRGGYIYISQTSKFVSNTHMCLSDTSLHALQCDQHI